MQRCKRVRARLSAEYITDYYVSAVANRRRHHREYSYRMTQRYIRTFAYKAMLIGPLVTVHLDAHLLSKH
jgi:hypothetical protein